MYVLEATRDTQGTRDDDYAWAVDGELVFLPLMDCDNPKCGCDRGFAGITSHRATTTACVTERTDLTEGDYEAVLLEGMEDQGYGMFGDDLLADLVGELVGAVQDLGELLGPGTVVGRSGLSLLVRTAGRALDR